MENLYGFKKDDAIALIKFLKERKNEPLSQVFEKYAKASNKAKGTIRNLYYTLSKLSLKDSEFCEKYLSGTPFKVEERQEFSPCEEHALLKQIFKKKWEGISVRKAVQDLSKGDNKLALRYQNKYRGLIKKDKKLVLQIISELKQEIPDFNIELHRGEKEVAFNEIQVRRLKNEINSLFERTFIELKKENAILREENEKINRQNVKLREILCGKEEQNSVLSYFFGGDKKDLIN